MEDLEFGLVGRATRNASLVLVSPRHAGPSRASVGKASGMSPRSPLGKSASARGTGADGYEDSPRQRSAASKHSRLALVFGAADSSPGGGSPSRSSSGRQRSGSGRPSAHPLPLRPPHNLPSLNLSRVVGGLHYSGGHEEVDSPMSSRVPANHKSGRLALISGTAEDRDNPSDGSSMEPTAGGVAAAGGLTPHTPPRSPDGDDGAMQPPCKTMMVRLRLPSSLSVGCPPMS